MIVTRKLKRSFVPIFKNLPGLEDLAGLRLDFSGTEIAFFEKRVFWKPTPLLLSFPNSIRYRNFKKKRVFLLYHQKLVAPIILLYY
ncbi:MAG: hypothetical protein DRQ49_13250 [Gammaproteobacteria bacterium]|nr:MAG: hypothetical protein DRQ49_13250 [Gammaproteobacteria bacterium]RKZ74828.1 MAG: hypothetical protein DRQ57_09670 [Gammaproteobacteria bacterium]